MIAGDVLGVHLLDQGVVHGVAHPLVEVADEIVDAKVAAALVEYAGLLQEPRLLIERGIVEVFIAPFARVGAESDREQVRPVRVALLRLPVVAIRVERLFLPSQARCSSAIEQRRLPALLQAWAASTRLMYAWGKTPGSLRAS